MISVLAILYCSLTAAQNNNAQPQVINWPPVNLT